MIELYYWTTPNGHKITIFLEEADIPYEIHPINIGKGDQFEPEFLKISPNNRIPAIIDRSPAAGNDPLSLFESGAILQYLAEKTLLIGGISKLERSIFYQRVIANNRFDTGAFVFQIAYAKRMVIDSVSPADWPKL